VTASIASGSLESSDEPARGATTVANDRLQRFYAQAWKGEGYSSDEALRLIKACDMIRREAESTATGQPWNVLDVGCGVGPLREWLPASGFRIHGIELSEEAARIARGRYDSCHVGDIGDDWPQAAASMDAVHAGAILEHVIDWHTPLNHANRVLRDGGLLVVSVPNLRYWKEVLRLVRGRLPLWMNLMSHLHAYTPQFLGNLLTIHGFQVLEIEADRLGIRWLPRQWRRPTRWFAGIGSTIIVAARLTRRVRVEDQKEAPHHPHHRPVGLRSIEVVG
jgi:2-polyprenyl-3-methyl-5-hydroxy-6-metoxy-1,4-benzoquinol methylase